MPAVASVPKELYLSSSLKDLNKKTEVKPEKTSTKNYVHSAQKIFKAAEECRLDRDEERAYVLYMKYVAVYNLIKKRPDFKQQQAGSVHVRIRRDANEQMVLAHVTNRLYTLVSTLTVQIFKDDWVRPALMSGPTAPGVLHFSDHHIIPMPLLKGTTDAVTPVTSTPAKPSSPPPEFAFNTPGKNMSPVILLNTQTRPYGLGLNRGHTPYSSVLSQGLTVPGFGAGQGLRPTFPHIPSRYGNNRTGQPRP